MLDRLADDLEERQALRAKLLGAAAYPAIVSLIAIVIVVFLVTYVVPQVASVFVNSKRALPGLTVAMLAISGAVRQWGWAGCWRWPEGMVGLSLALREESFRQRFDAAWLRLPLIGRLARGYNAARFAGTLAMLANAGVPILKALQAAAETLGNRAMRADALDALVQVRGARRWFRRWPRRSASPGCWPCSPAWASRPTSCRRCSIAPRDKLGGEVQRRAMAPSHAARADPHRAMGGVVMLIVLAVLLPIIQLNTWVKWARASNSATMALPFTAALGLRVQPRRQARAC